jgi:hypothetical protein
MLGIDAIGTPLGPRVRLTFDQAVLVLTHGEAQRVAQWIWDAAELVELDQVTEQCHHCHDYPPAGHTCPACGRSAPNA